ncbi:MAG: hypothetical protein GDA41_01660 [Rhodospirillales bacterium]|nr:hypothetical protein [Rhodospirillales bacterium]
MTLGMKARAVSRNLGLVAGLGAFLTACTQQPLPAADPAPARAPPHSGQPQPVVGRVPPPAVSAYKQTAVPQRILEIDAGGWAVPEAASERHRADLQSCYAFATAQVRNDARINDDRSTVLNTRNAALAGNLFAYGKAIGPYANKQRFDRLFRGCLVSRGYRRN